MTDYRAMAVQMTKDASAAAARGSGAALDAFTQALRAAAAEALRAAADAFGACRHDQGQAADELRARADEIESGRG